MLPFKTPIPLPAFGTGRGGMTYPPPVPTYEQLYAEVLDKVRHTAIGDRPSDEQHAHTQDIMDALAEAYHIGHNNGMKYVNNIVLSSGDLVEPEPNPYEKQPTK